jgi:hypothetical protein
MLEGTYNDNLSVKVLLSMSLSSVEVTNGKNYYANIETSNKEFSIGQRW